MKLFDLDNISPAGFVEIENQLNTVDNAVTSGYTFLYRNAGNHISFTNTNLEVRDNFSQLLILEATGKKELIAMKWHSRTWNYFIGKPVGTSLQYPDDLDTTSLAWTVLPASSEVIQSILDEILTLVNEDGIVPTYFDKKRSRIDPTVCINVLHLCYHYGYDNLSCLQPTRSYILSVLKDRSYLSGTRYYSSPEAFLFFLARLIECNCARALCTDILPLLQERIWERVGQVGDALELSMRILAGLSTGLGQSNNCSQNIWDKDVENLRRLQCQDGSWETGWLCRYGSTGVLVGNRGLTTALALKALEGVRRAGNHE